MKRLLLLFKQRAFLGFLGVVLLGLIVWFIGPYLALGPYVPFAGVAARGITIAAIGSIWGLLTFLRWRRSRQAGEQLGAAIVASGKADDQQGQELRQRFEEAIAFLKSSRQGRNLYQLPWYVIVGPPGSGKTTALIHSGLNFPLDERFGRDALRGVGGTRNCDWWFTDEAVLLDTAGRYFTQDSDAGSDATEWNRFLDLIRKYRKRRPINGVLVTLSAGDLLTSTEESRRRHAETVRKRIDELQRQLQIQVPVYFLVTKCDLIAGFVEFFDDLGHEGRAQVWGATRPEPTVGGAPSKWLDEQFDGLLARLDARLLQRMDQEREPGRRARIFGFPRQLAGLRDSLLAFVRETFEGTGFDRPVMLRGLYFTSGTQEGTPIDRMMDSVSRAYGMQVASDTGGATQGQGRAYFIHRLLKDVVFPESGLAGVNWRLEVGRAVFQNVAYLTLFVLLGVLVAGWFTSYQYNRGYLADVSAALEVHAETATRPVPGDAGLTDVLPRLDALGEVSEEANRHRDDVPVMMRLGLYRGAEVGDSARQAYLQGVRELLVPRVVLLLEQRLSSTGTPATQVYAYLKGYLMLAEPDRLVRDELDAIVQAALLNEFQDSRALARSLALHFRAYVDSARSFPAIETDDDLVARARSSLRQASLPALMLSSLEVSYDEGHPAALRLDREAGLGADQIFRRRSGTPLSQPIPALYTRGGFEEITGDVGGELIDAFMEDRWVFGDDILPGGRSGRLDLAADFLRHYEEAYIAYWEELLNDLEMSPLMGVEDATEMLAAITGPTSPLRQLLGAMRRQVRFPPPDDEDERPGGRIGALLGLADRAAGDNGDQRPGARVDAHFQQFRQYVAGEDGADAPLDGLMALLDQLYEELSAFDSGFGDQDAMTLLGRGGGDTLGRLRSEAARTPPPFDAWLDVLAGSGQEAALRNLRNQLNQRYRSAVLPVCEELTAGRYPFDEDSDRDIAPSDFARLFGPDGVIDSYFAENLAPLVDTGGARWRWRSGQAAALGIPQAALDQFQRARLIQELFFRDGDGPAIAFDMTPRYLDARARQFRVALGEQALVYRHGPPLVTQFEWAGTGSDATVAFEDRSGQRPNVSYAGGWSWLRALEAAQPAAESDTAYLASFDVDGYSARVLVEFSSSRNPLRRSEWRRFRCIGGL